MEPQVEDACLFEDPDFPSEVSSLCSSDVTPISTLQGDINWLRPKVVMRGVIKTDFRCAVSEVKSVHVDNKFGTYSL